MVIKLNCCRGNESPTDLDRGKIIMRDANLPVIWVFGGRCSGKTTLSSKIGDKYQLQHIDCDNVLRFEALRQSARGVDIMARLNRHERLPHDILVKLLREIMPRHVKVTKGYIIDNFPVNLDQGKLFEEKICKVTAILYLKANHKTMLKRYRRRENETKEGKAPSLVGTELFFRPVAVHDVVLQPERIDTQLNDFQAISSSVVENYFKIIHVIDADRSEEEMFRGADDVIKALTKTLDIPDRGNINEILIKHFLVDKSALPPKEDAVISTLESQNAEERRSSLASIIGSSRLKVSKASTEEEKRLGQDSMKVAGFTSLDDGKSESFRDSLRRRSQERSTADSMPGGSASMGRSTVSTKGQGPSSAKLSDMSRAGSKDSQDEVGAARPSSLHHSSPFASGAKPSAGKSKSDQHKPEEKTQKEEKRQPPKSDAKVPGVKVHESSPRTTQATTVKKEASVMSYKNRAASNMSRSKSTLKKK